MKIEAMGTGATVEEARMKAIAELAAPEDADVHTEIIAYPAKKILGLFGGSPAKAKAYYEIPDEPKAAPKAPKAEKKIPADKKKAEQAKKAVKTEKTEESARVQETEQADNTPVNVADSKSLTVAVNYLKDVLGGMGVSDVSVAAYRNRENEIIFDLDCGDDYGIVIGRRGETLDSIQYLTRLVANKYKTENEYLRISINVGSYREKRKTALRELAKKNSQKVLKYGRNVTFEPMNPYERRIIHTAVQEIEGVTSHSVGTDANRRVVITLAEGVKPTNPSRNGYNNRGRGGRGGYNNNRGGKRTSSVVDAPTRAPRTDAGAEKVSLYGKIN